MRFSEHINLPPIPFNRRKSARQSAAFVRRATELGSLETVVDEALAAITGARATEEPSELLRLRLLYQKVYTDEELRSLIEASIRQFGLT